MRHSLIVSLHRFFSAMVKTLIFSSILAFCIPLTIYAGSQTYQPLIAMQQRLQVARDNAELSKLAAITLYDAEALINNAANETIGRQQSLIDHYLYLADLKLKIAYTLLDNKHNQQKISELRNQRDLMISKYIAEQSRQRASRDTVISKLRGGPAKERLQK